ncbi:MAG: methyltransferase domain-containing protein [Alphaproteobacteria bacterium]|nr:methyltransferase domain-containing protein [Alphaproteobacteria bacterium]
MRILDMGCGEGGATLCLAWRLPRAEVHGLDLRADAITRLRASSAKNGFGERVAARVHDVSAGAPRDHQSAFDWVVSNPPYLPAERADRRARCNGADAETVETVPLSAWIDCMLACANAGGHVLLVHRADRIDEVISGLRDKAGDLVVVPLARAREALRRCIRAWCCTNRMGLTRRARVRSCSTGRRSTFRDLIAGSGRTSLWP